MTFFIDLLLSVRGHLDTHTHTLSQYHSAYDSGKLCGSDLFRCDRCGYYIPICPV